MPQPFFYLLCPDGSALLGQPVALILGQAGSQLLEDLAVVGVQPIQLVAAQHAGDDGGGGDGHERHRTEGEELAVLVGGLVLQDCREKKH